MRRFMAHDSTDLVLPREGIVTITGENGAGKSTFIEAVAWSCWGKTLRGDVPWRGDAKEPCYASALIDDDLEVRRERKGAKTELDFDSAGTEFPSKTKGQAVLDTILGSYDLWRRSHVFSSSDATHFTLATDADRKRLIEAFLGTDRFDPALAACRDDLKAATARLTAATSKHGLATARLEGEKRSLAESTAALEAAPPLAPFPVSPGKQVAEFDALIAAAKKEIFAIEQRLREADRAGGSDEAVARSAQVMLDRLKAAACPTCSQPIPGDLRLKLTRDVAAAQASAAIAKKKANVGRAELEAAIDELSDELAAVQAKRTERSTAVRLEQQAQAEVDRAHRGRQLLTVAVKRATEDIARLKREMVDLEEAIDEATGDVAELSEVEKVLGLKGVRAHILGDSLGGIEAVANTWLARMKQGVSLSLRPYSELKKGGTDDSISLEVVGLGRGTYKSTSGGERRRVDVALLLALGEVAAAARGIAAGTLWFDEVFDCLDDAGIEAIGDVLTELSQARCVVVITHSKPLIQRLRASRSIHVTRGVTAA